MMAHERKSSFFLCPERLHQKRDKNPILRGSNISCVKPPKVVLDPKHQHKATLFDCNISKKFGSAAPRLEAYFNNHIQYFGHPPWPPLMGPHLNTVRNSRATTTGAIYIGIGLWSGCRRPSPRQKTVCYEPRESQERKEKHFA